MSTLSCARSAPHDEMSRPGAPARPGARPRGREPAREAGSPPASPTAFPDRSPRHAAAERPPDSPRLTGQTLAWVSGWTPVLAPAPRCGGLGGTTTTAYRGGDRCDAQRRPRRPFREDLSGRHFLPLVATMR